MTLPCQLSTDQCPNFTFTHYQTLHSKILAASLNNLHDVTNRNSIPRSLCSFARPLQSCQAHRTWHSPLVTPSNDITNPRTRTVRPNNPPTSRPNIRPASATPFPFDILSALLFATNFRHTLSQHLAHVFSVSRDHWVSYGRRSTQTIKSFVHLVARHQPNFEVGVSSRSPTAANSIRVTSSLRNISVLQQSVVT